MSAWMMMKWTLNIDISAWKMVKLTLNMDFDYQYVCLEDGEVDFETEN